jgi:hypothetical protein
VVGPVARARALVRALAQEGDDRLAFGGSSWIVRRANRLLSTGYLARREADPPAEVHVLRPWSVAVDVVGLVYWAVMLAGLLFSVFLLPGAGRKAGEPGPAWELPVFFTAIGAGWLFISWLWTEVRSRIGFPILFTQGDVFLARWEEAQADTWSLAGADGQELARAVREPRLRTLMRLAGRRRWDFTAADKELAYRPSTEWHNNVFPIRLESDELTVVVKTPGLFEVGWRVECQHRPGNEAGRAATEMRGPELLALCLGVFCIEMGRGAF